MLTPQVPYPPRQGTALRNWGLLRGLARHHRVALLSFAAPDQSLTPPPPLTERVAQVALLPQPRRHLRDRLRDLAFTSQPDLTQRLASDAFRRQLRAWLDAAPTGAAFDWVLVEGLELAGYLDEVWGREDHPRVAFDAHNCEYLLQKRAAATDRFRPRRWPGALYSAVQWRRLRRYEARICRRADLVVAVSQADAEALRRIAPSVTPMVVPNGISVATYAGCTAREPLAQPAFVFTGTMDFRPNVDGVLWFVREVWPRVRAALPEAHFYVVGRRPHPRLAPLRERPDVVVTGSVPDTRPYIGAARVYVVPLLVGGGTRLKLLESTAMGKAVVSTRLGAEGFPDREDAMQLADTPAAFARACVRLAQDADARRALEQRARAFAVRYDWDALLPPLVARLARPPAG
jgi:glycosyltransferase involved in cell wall biosynthesis